MPVLALLDPRTTRRLLAVLAFRAALAALAALFAAGCAGSAFTGSSRGRILAVGAENEYANVIGQIGVVGVDVGLAGINRQGQTGRARPAGCLDDGRTGHGDDLREG